MKTPHFSKPIGTDDSRCFDGALRRSETKGNKGFEEKAVLFMCYQVCVLLLSAKK